MYSSVLRCLMYYQNIKFYLTGMRLSETDKKDLIIWENVNALEYLRKTEAKKSDILENVVMRTSAR